MTYSDLQLVINEAYSYFSENYIGRKRLGSSKIFLIKNLFLIKAIYKVLMNQEGDEAKDVLSKVQIQSIIQLFNKYSNSTIQIEYD